MLRRLRAELRLPVARPERLVPVHPALAGLLDGGLKPGSVVSVASGGVLLAALLAAPSAAGSWCGVVGLPDFGVEAAERASVELGRLVLVPWPGDQWLTVASAVTEVHPVVALRPGGRVRDADAARLAARLRDRGAVLITVGVWPQADVVLGVERSRWTGVGDGHGYLESQELRVVATTRRSPQPRRATVIVDEGAMVESSLAAPTGLRAVSWNAVHRRPRPDWPRH